MKFKVIISLLLALVMLGVLAIPALADAPTKITIRPGINWQTPFTGTGTLTLQMNKTNHIDVDLDIKGAIQGNYYLTLWYGSASDYLLIRNGKPAGKIEYVSFFKTDANGHMKCKGTTVDQFTPGTTVYVHPGLFENASRQSAYRFPDYCPLTCKKYK
jgi:hypothetical protein